MSNSHRYKTIIKKTSGLYKEKGSKFISYLFYANSERAFKDEMEIIHQEHPTARHFCYAYRFGADKKVYRANDDGEPNNSAGAPILGQIQSYDLTNVGIVVVRYFGGTKLGVGGLISAYREAAKEAIELNDIIEKEDDVRFKLTCDYETMPHMMNATKKGNWNIVEQTFENDAVIKIEVPLSKISQFQDTFAPLNITIEEEK